MVEYTEYREHIRRRRAWTWGPLSCVSSAAVSFSHVLVEHTDFPSMYTSWTDRDTLLSACTVHIVIFCIAVLWIILPVCMFTVCDMLGVRHTYTSMYLTLCVDDCRNQSILRLYSFS